MDAANRQWTPAGERPDPRAVRSFAALTAACIELVDEGEIGAITITAVTARAGVSRPTFYKHFETLDQLLHAAGVQRLSAALTAAAESAAGEDAATDQLGVTLRGTVAHLRDHATFYRRLFNGPSAVALLRSIASILEERIAASRMGIVPESDDDLARADRVAMATGGAMLMIVEWLDTDLTGANSVAGIGSRLLRMLTPGDD